MVKTLFEKTKSYIIGAFAEGSVLRMRDGRGIGRISAGKLQKDAACQLLEERKTASSGCPRSNDEDDFAGIARS